MKLSLCEILIRVDWICIMLVSSDERERDAWYYEKSKIEILGL